MDKKKNEKYYKIGEVADMLGVHEDTLRNWDTQGLIVAERVGRRKDRRYTAEHIKKIKDEGLVSNLAKRQPNNRDYSNYSKEQLIKELQILQKQKKYGLVWEDKPEEVVEMCKTQAAILKPVSKMNVVGKNDEQNHILIEGDNYHALQVLNYTHKGKIDVIYIDPPYNTGNNDFIYNDAYVDREDGYRHSKWLSFMEKRLRLAKKLLKRTGIIFISIDDNEHAQLKLFCDEIFGHRNFINNFIWINNLKGRQLSNYGASKTYEHILCYGISEDKIGIFEGNIERLKKTSPEVYKNREYEIFQDDKGEYVIKNELHNTNSDFNEETRPNLVFDIYYNPKSKKVKLNLDKKDGGYIKINPKKNNDGVHKYHAWRWSKDKIINEINDLEFVKSDNTYKIFTKIRDIYTTKIKDIITNINTNSGGIELQSIFGKKEFAFPKPLDLIAFLLEFSASKESIILDFMAGSGTTGHAVMELNKQDSGNRQFILCTNNENNNNGNEHGGIAENVCQPRIKKVMKGYKKNGNGEKVEGLGGNLEYLKTEFVDVENIGNVSDKKRLAFTHEAGHVIALKENAFKELEKNKWYQVFTDGKDTFVGIYFRENLEKLGELEQKILNKKEVKLYIFSHSGSSDWVGEYDEYDNVSVEDIPEPILKVYRSLNS